MNNTYASIVTARSATREGPTHEIVTVRDSFADGGTAPNAVVDGCSTGDDVGNSVAQEATPDAPETCGQAAATDGARDEVTVSSQPTELVGPSQRTEVSEQHCDFPTRHDGESRNPSIKFWGASPVRRRENAGAKSESEDEAIDNRDDTLVHRERERTPELRRSPKRNKKMKIDKLGEQQHERYRSLPRKASLKSVKV